jgi:hypothetical protein
VFTGTDGREQGPPWEIVAHAAGCCYDGGSTPHRILADRRRGRAGGTTRTREKETPMVIRRHALSAAGLAVAACVLLGCSGPAADAGSAAKPGASAAQAQPAQKAGKQNACALVNREAIEGIAGNKLFMLHNIEDTDQTTCELSGEGSDQVLVYVKVYWKGGKEMADAEQAAMGLAKRMLNSPDVDIEELTGSGDVRGLADKAFFSDLMPSWVLKGDVLIQVISPLWPHDKTLATFTSVAKSALPKL